MGSPCSQLAMADRGPCARGARLEPGPRPALIAGGPAAAKAALLGSLQVSEPTIDGPPTMLSARRSPGLRRPECFLGEGELRPLD